MYTQPNPFLLLDKKMVIGALKATRSNDEDVLHAQKATLLSSARFPRMVGTYLMIVGGLCTATILLAIIGIPMLIAGWWFRRRGARNVEAVEAGFTDHLAAIGLCVALALGTFVGPVHAVPAVDQNNSVLPVNNFTSIRAGFTAAQTFTVGYDGTLSEVRAVIDPRGTPVEVLTLDVQGVTGGVPDGVAIATASVAPFGGTNPTVSFDVSGAALAVTAGQELAFVLKTNAIAPNDYLARAVPGNKYGGGEFTDSGGAFGTGAGWDGIFKVLVDPAGVPGPGASDQANAQTPTGNFAAIAAGLTAAQTFTVGATGTLSRIDVMVDPRNTPVLDLTLEVQETTAGAPNGNVLAVAHLAPFGGTNPIVSFDVGPYNLAVTSGEHLAFVLRSHAAGGIDYLARAVPGDTYAGGQFTNSSGGFADGGGWDAIFETFVDPGIPVSVDPLAWGSGLSLAPGAPNPAQRGTLIRFMLPAAGPAELGVFDVSGRRVATLADRVLAEGPHELRWNLTNERGIRVEAGIYFTRLLAGGVTRTTRLAVVD